VAEAVLQEVMYYYSTVLQYYIISQEAVLQQVEEEPVSDVAVLEGVGGEEVG
jgi:hypothetical protein